MNQQYTPTANAVSDKFEISRLFFLIRREFAYNKRLILLGAAALFGILCMVGALNGYIASPNPDSMPAGKIFASNTSAFFSLYTLYIITGAYLSYAASLAFAAFSDRRTRLNAMIYPALKIEKFITALVVYVLAPLVVVLIADACSELIRKAFLPSEYLWMWQNELVDAISQEVEEAGDLVLGYKVQFIVTVLTAQAVFFFGSILWPKWSFFKTLLAAWLLSTLIGFVFLALGATGNFAPINILYAQITTYVLVFIAAYACAWLRYDKVRLIQRFMK